MSEYKIPLLPLTQDVETKAVLKQTIAANRCLAELKGVVKTVPNASILINTLSLQEAKDSSEIESIITTHDELYKAELFVRHIASPAAKEVQTYAEALRTGYDAVMKNHLLTCNDIINIYRNVKQNTAGFRATPGTTLQNERTKEIVYRPPQTYDEIVRYMSNLEQFINDDSISDLDPLVKMAIIHHQFESIHPFSDGNGRTGRIVNILFLAQKQLLELPILYLSRYIIKNKAEYYKLLQGVRDSGMWEDWIVFMLKGVEVTSIETIKLVESIKSMMLSYKKKIREEAPKIYSQDLINNLFRHPYTKIDFVMQELSISRPTAISYLNKLVDDLKILEKIKMGRENFYVNVELFNLLLNAFHFENISTDSVDSKV